MSKSICNIPEELLKSQVTIETIPDIFLLMMLTAITALVVFYWNIWRGQFGKAYQEHIRVGVVFALLLIGVPTWYQASGLLTDIVTNLANPEYAAIVKFNNTCGQMK